MIAIQIAATEIAIKMISVQIKALIAEIRGGGEDKEETDETEDNKGATTGALIGRQGEKRTKR